MHHFPPRAPSIRPWWALLLWGPAWLVLSVFTLWAAGALWFDLPGRAGAVALLLLQLGFLASLVRSRRGPAFCLLVATLPPLLTLGWWLTLQPSDTRAWQPDVAEKAWGEVEGRRVTLHYVRDFEYRTLHDYTPHWETRVVDLTRLTALDVAITQWGAPLLAHPILSFQFSESPPVCFSIETRKEVGEEYSALRGFYRQYELIYLCAEERDVLRLRTNYRPGEEVFLYRTTATPEGVRTRFLEYVAAMNQVREHPRWYHAITSNCTTAIRAQRTAAERLPWDWRILLNGRGDEWLYQRGALVTQGLPFPELKRRARINAAARAADAAPDFSTRIREGRPGFGTWP